MESTVLWSSMHKVFMLHFFKKISFFRKPHKIFWTVFTSHIHKRAKYCVTLYCILTAGTANVILPGENSGIERTPLWTNDRHLTVPATLIMTYLESAGVTLPLEFQINFSSVFMSENVTTVISLLLEEIPERLSLGSWESPRCYISRCLRPSQEPRDKPYGLFPSKHWNNFIMSTGLGRVSYRDHFVCRSGHS